MGDRTPSLVCHAIDCLSSLLTTNRASELCALRWCYAVSRGAHESIDGEPAPRETLHRRGVRLGLHLGRVVRRVAVHRPLFVLHLLEHLNEMEN